jgi:hypothetical protein
LLQSFGDFAVAATAGAQVLILLRTLLLPGKQPIDTLKDKSRMQVRRGTGAR